MVRSPAFGWDLLRPEAGGSEHCGHVLAIEVSSLSKLLGYERLFTRASIMPTYHGCRHM